MRVPDSVKKGEGKPWLLAKPGWPARLGKMASCPTFRVWILIWACVLLALSACQTAAQTAQPLPLTTPVTAVIAPATLPSSPMDSPVPTGAAPGATDEPAGQPTIQEYAIPAGSRPHDVAPAADGGVWYTAQGSGELGWLDPASGETRRIPLGPGSAPHGVVLGPDKAPWITDGGLNALLRVDPVSGAVQTFPLPPEGAGANLNTAVFDSQGVLWFTGQDGFYGRLDLAQGVVQVFPAPGGRGPYGIAAVPSGDVYYASLAGSHIARIPAGSFDPQILELPTPGQGARRVWPDSQGRIWVSEWNAGQVAVYDPQTDAWREWRLPGENPMPYAVYVDEQDWVWLSDFGANALVRFDPLSESFTVFPLPSASANVRQLHGRPGEVWGAESGVGQLVVIRY